MNPIHPNLPPGLPQTQAPKPAAPTRAAAQKAFFEIAMGKAPATAASAPAAAAPAPVQRAIRTLPQGEAPARPLRPGSLLDIRV